MNAPGQQIQLPPPPECRFCFEPQRTPTDPLITPCPCKGSVQFVHWLCLKRWVQLNPATNGQACTICRLPFQVTAFPGLEQVSGPAFALFCVRHTYAISSAVSYALIAWNYYYALPKEGDTPETVRWEMFRTGCLLSQMWYIGCLALVWRVQHRGLYRRLAARTSRLPWLLLVHAYAQGSITWRPEEAQYTCMVLIYLALQMYWAEHVGVLARVNGELLVEDDRAVA
jgi:hypothetical protein